MEQFFLYAWLITTLIFLILELSTGGFYLLSFAIGALSAVIVSLIGGNVYWQLALFVAISLMSLFLVRPFAMKVLRTGKKERLSNADAIIGRTATVSEHIPADGFGRVAIDGDDWKAQADDETTSFAKGEKVTVKSRDSIILTVTKK